MSRQASLWTGGGIPSTYLLKTSDYYKVMLRDNCFALRDYILYNIACLFMGSPYFFKASTNIDGLNLSTKFTNLYYLKASTLIFRRNNK